MDFCLPSSFKQIGLNSLNYCPSTCDFSSGKNVTDPDALGMRTASPAAALLPTSSFLSPTGTTIRTPSNEIVGGFVTFEVFVVRMFE